MGCLLPLLAPIAAGGTAGASTDNIAWTRASQGTSQVAYSHTKNTQPQWQGGDVELFGSLKTERARVPPRFQRRAHKEAATFSYVTGAYLSCHGALGRRCGKRLASDRFGPNDEDREGPEKEK